MFEIKKAVRRGVPPLIGLWGGSGSGKTWSALHIARGMVGPSGKIGVIDTENQRACFYSDQAGGFDHLDLQPPFSPARYTEALATFEQAGGYGCIIVDSFSHAWDAQGGVLDMADSGRTKDGRMLTGLKKWQAPKIEYKRMVNALLRAPFAMIFCLRAKDGVKQVGVGEHAKIENIGVQPVAGKGLIYEMTISALIGPDHCPVFQGSDSLIQADPLIPSLKAPEALRDIFQRGVPLGVETGQRIAAWVAGGVAFDVDHAKLERVARDVATMGSASLERHWKALGGPAQRALAAIKEELKSIAAEADQQAANDEPTPYDTETGEMRL